MPQTRQDLLRGAAYRVVYERVDPDGCTTAEKYAALHVALAGMTEWANGQVDEVRDAYLLVIPEINLRAKTTLENNERSRALVDAYGMIPKPE